MKNTAKYTPIRFLEILVFLGVVFYAAYPTCLAKSKRYSSLILSSRQKGLGFPRGRLYRPTEP